MPPLVVDTESSCTGPCCLPHLFPSQALCLGLGSMLVDELDCFIWWKRIQLGEVASILRRLLAQGLHPHDNRTWPPLPRTRSQSPMRSRDCLATISLTIWWTGVTSSLASRISGAWTA